MSSDAAAACPVCKSSDVAPDETLHIRLCQCQRCSARWLDGVAPRNNVVAAAAKAKAGRLAASVYKRPCLGCYGSGQVAAGWNGETEYTIRCFTCSGSGFISVEVTTPTSDAAS